MVVSETIGQEAIFLGVAILVGVGLFFLYDLFRILRRIIPHGVIWISVEDFFYWIICTGAVFVMLYQENDGMVRGFALGGVVVGMLLYYLLLSRLVIRVNVLVLKKILGIVGKIAGVLLGPIWRLIKKLGRMIRKELKKFIRAVKMSLCKL